MAAAVVQLAVESRKPILALDLPTGVNATTGETTGLAISAATTLMLDLPKKGLTLPISRPYVGAIYLADLGIPAAVHAQMGISTGGLFSEGPIVRLRR